MRYQVSIRATVLSVEIARRPINPSEEVRRQHSQIAGRPVVKQLLARLPQRTCRKGIADSNAMQADREWEWTLAAARSSSDYWARLLLSHDGARDQQYRG